MKPLLMLVALLFLSGCSWFEPRIKLRTETQEVFKPILYCPAPDWTELDSPMLAIDGIMQDTPPGEVAKRYKATVQQLETHNLLLIKTLQRYDNTNDAYKQLEEQFKKELEKGSFDINTEESKPLPVEPQ